MKLFRLAEVFAACVLAVTGLSAQKGTMRIAAIDVEGGQATLFVAPGGQSLLVDTGWAGNDGRDADRIVAAAKAMGLSRIDHVLITHYHADHAGGVPQLVERIPVGGFLDHGELFAGDKEPPKYHDEYVKVLATGKYQHTVIKAGEKLPLTGFDAVAISSNGDVMQQPLGGKPAENPLCADAPISRVDNSENGHSLGIVIRFAGLTIVDAGDLTADRERSLVCPGNRIGKVDLLVVSHHGVDLSSSRLFVHSLRPRLAIMDNGDHKGGSTSVIDTIRSSPGLEALYQLHVAPPAGAKQPAGTVQGGPEHNVPEEFIANTAGVDGKRVDVTIQANGTIAVRNERTGMVKTFPRRRR